MQSVPIKINRAPVLTLWAAIVAQRLGFDHDEALTLGRALAGLNAQAKGQRLGIFEPTAEGLKEIRHEQPSGEFLIALLGRAIPALMTAHGLRAVEKGTVGNGVGSGFNLFHSNEQTLRTQSVPGLIFLLNLAGIVSL